jgi:hypothetical protein
MSGLMQCWQDIAQFQQFLQCMLSQMGPIPIQGVTDGSDAKAGYIGEYITGQSPFTYTAYPNITTVNLSPLVVSPGDWNLWSFAGMATEFGAVQYGLSPVPAGVYGGLGAVNSIGGASPVAEYASVMSPTTRANVTVPTLLPFTLTVHQDTSSSLPAGNGILYVFGRRVR